jgi:Type II secretion system (T2SS), protein M subtype b
LLDIVRRTARAQAPPVELGAVEFQSPARLGDYAEVRIGVLFSCHIEELLNLLADLASQPEAIAVDEMRISAADPKQKTVSVHLTVSGVVPRRLVPDKKGVAPL